MRGHVGVQLAIDTPRSQQDVGQPFVLAGWAYPLVGGARLDVAAIYGDQFRGTGFTLAVQGLPPGIYDLAVFPWSNVAGAFVPPQIVHVTVR